MNTYRNILVAASVMATALTGLTACDGTDDPVYDYVAKPTNERVYFASQTASVVAGDDVTSTVIPIYRPDAVAADTATVRLTVSDPEGLFSVPAEVTFEAGETETVVPVDFATTSMEVSRPYSVLIAIDSAQANEYGIDAITLTVVRESWTEWTELGEGAFTLDAWYGPEDPAEAQVPGLANVRYLATDSSAMQFEFYVAFDYYYGDPTLYPYFIAETRDGGRTLSIPEYQVGTHPAYGPVYQGEAGLGKSSYNPATGLFTFNIECYVGAGSFGTFTEYFQLDNSSADSFRQTSQFPLLIPHAHRSLPLR